MSPARPAVSAAKARPRVVRSAAAATGEDATAAQSEREHSVVGVVAGEARGRGMVAVAVADV
nr:unnamed protein product [Digitaria exilis]